MAHTRTVTRTSNDRSELATLRDTIASGAVGTVRTIRIQALAARDTVDEAAGTAAACAEAALDARVAAVSGIVVPGDGTDADGYRQPALLAFHAAMDDGTVVAVTAAERPERSGSEIAVDVIGDRGSLRIVEPLARASVRVADGADPVQRERIVAAVEVSSDSAGAWIDVERMHFAHEL